MRRSRTILAAGQKVIMMAADAGGQARHVCVHLHSNEQVGVAVADRDTVAAGPQTQTAATAAAAPSPTPQPLSPPSSDVRCHLLYLPDYNMWLLQCYWSGRSESLTVRESETARH